MSGSTSPSRRGAGFSEAWGEVVTEAELAEAELFFADLVGRRSPPLRWGESWDYAGEQAPSVTVDSKTTAVFLTDPDPTEVTVKATTNATANERPVQFEWKVTRSAMVVDLVDAKNQTVTVRSTKPGRVDLQVTATFRTSKAESKGKSKGKGKGKGKGKVKVASGPKIKKATGTARISFVGMQLPKMFAMALPPKKTEAMTPLELTADVGKLPGTFVWDELTNKKGVIAIKGGKDKNPLVVEANTPSSAETKLQYRTALLDKQAFVGKTKAVFFRIEPAVKAVAANASGELLELEVKGTLDTGTRKWVLPDNDFNATVKGPTDKEKLQIQCDQAGSVQIELQYTPEGGGVAVVSHGAVAFVACPISHLAVGQRPRTKLPLGPRNRLDLLIQHSESADPGRFKTGRLMVESDPRPRVIESEGLGTDAGTFAWTKPTAGRFIRFADNQPGDTYGRDKSKVVVLALAKDGPVGPNDRLGFADEQVELTRQLHGVTVTDRVDVRVHRWGCSGVRWERGGANEVTYQDRINPCPHKANPQWMVPNSNPPRRIPHTKEPTGGGGTVPSHGHQHGGKCGYCSSTTREVWHWVPVHDEVRAHATRLADLLREFANDDIREAGTHQENNQDFVHGKTLFTTEAWKTLHTGNAPRGRMLGVLRGKRRDDNRWVWRYGLSGGDDLEGDWATPADLRGRRGRKRIVGYRTNADYGKEDDGFNVEALRKSWDQFGTCAATRVLNSARANRLHEIQMAEVWVEPNRNLRHFHFVHGDEIGSCAQCRRYLGRMLCEIGER